MRNFFNYQGTKHSKEPTTSLYLFCDCYSCLLFRSVQFIIVNSDDGLIFKWSELQTYYRSGTVNLNTVNSKFHLIRSFFEIFARFLLFHVLNARLIQTR